MVSHAMTTQSFLIQYYETKTQLSLFLRILTKIQHENVPEYNPMYVFITQSNKNEKAYE